MKILCINRSADGLNEKLGRHDTANFNNTVKIKIDR